MEFSYETARIKELCEKRVPAVEEFGEEAALDLERRLADLEACDNAVEFLVLCEGDLVQLAGHRWRLQLRGGASIEFISGHLKQLLTETGETDWSKVTRLRIKAIRRQL